MEKNIYVLSVPTGYSALALSSCRRDLVKGRPSPIHYIRTVEDVGLQSEPFSKQRSDSLHVSSAGASCQMLAGATRFFAFSDKTGSTSVLMLFTA